MKIKSLLLLILFTGAGLLMFSCENSDDNSLPIENPLAAKSSIKPIMDADIAFSDMSRQIGLKKAFMEFISPEGVLLRPDFMPLAGAESVNYLSQVNDEGFELSWAPSGGDISSDGDMGFTYGVYQLKTADTTLSGTYVNIWKKQRDGSWKYVLNNTNEGTLPNSY